jgi:hypothetical protein
MSAISKDGVELLDNAYEMFFAEQVSAAVKWLIGHLRDFREMVPPRDWTLFCQSVCLRHPISGLIHQSPFARRAFEKPRGYAGDAETLDFAYGCAKIPEGTSDLGVEIYGEELESSAVRTIRERRDMLAAMVDRAAERSHLPRVLSIACGHLREAQLSRAVAEGRVGEYVALDHDDASLALINREQRASRITTVHGSVKGLLKRQLQLGSFDLVYTAGLYDYLPVPVARSLTRLGFSMLRPGGHLVVANCAREWNGTGYMEAFMEWNLIYRDEAEMQTLAALITESEIDSINIFRDSLGNVIFLEIEKR